MDAKTKYIIIGVIIVILIIAVIVAVTVTKSGTTEPDNNESFGTEESGDSTTYEPISMSDDVQISFEDMDDELAEEYEEHHITTTLTTAYQPEATTVPTDKTEQKTNSSSTVTEKTTVKTENSTSAADSVLSQINSFFKGHYYFDGIMISNGESAPMELAMNGNDFIVYSEMDGIDMGILYLDDEFYLINPNEKKYTVINSTVQKMMDLDVSTFSFDFNNTGFNGYSPTEVTEALYDGQSAVCYTYKDSKNNIDFVVVNDEIIQFVQYNTDGSKKTVIQFDEFTTDYSADMVSLNGYKKTNLLSFITELMKQE